MKGLRVYFLPNSDGRHELLVAAANQAAALFAMGSSVYSFRNYGGRRTEDPALAAVALAEPGRVFRRLIEWGLPRDAPNPWRPVDRYGG
jgi:hypothetical protein